MHGAEWLLLIGTVALLVGPLAALHAASKIREYRRKRGEGGKRSKHRED
jgi:hypothetical protein